MDKTTHIGIVASESYRSRTSEKQVKLKETPKFWVSEYGDRYRKDTADQNGVISIRKGGTWDRWTDRLDTKSIRPLTTKELREPLVAQMDRATIACDAARDELDKATAVMEQAAAARQKAVEALVTFDAKRGNR